MDEISGDVPCVTGIADDILVYCYNNDFSDHDENFRSGLQYACDTGFRFNLDKCKFRCTRFLFFGYIIGAEDHQEGIASLQCFDSIQPVTILVDASQRDLGAVLLQASGSAELAVKLLTVTESRYSNIEREMLVVWLEDVPLLCLWQARCCGI